MQTAFFVGLFIAAAVSDPVFLRPGAPQLFVDDFLIEHSEHLQRTLHTPRKDDHGDKPVIALADEFEDYPATLEANGSIVFDPLLNQYVMYCIGYSPAWRQQSEWDCVRLYRFTSPDGLTWIKGSDGTPQCVWPRVPDDLLDEESGARATYIDMFSCFYDLGDPQWPYKGWNHFANWGDEREGIYYMRSHDGISWERGPMVVNGCGGAKDPSARRFLHNGHSLQGPGDVTLFSHDPLSGRFLGLFKFYSPDALPNGSQLRSRAYAWVDGLDAAFDTARIDHVELIPPGAASGGDSPADEYYSASAWRYGDQWLGGLKIWHGADDYPWSAAGCAFMKLATSRDGLNWSKVSYSNPDGVPEVWLENGVEGGNDGKNDGGYITEFSQGPLRIGKELVYYYGASSFGKNAGQNRRLSGGGIFRARLRPDGFVSVDGGTLTTRPLRTDAPALLFNLEGEVQAELLGLNGGVLSSTTLAGDSTDARFTLTASPFRLRLTVPPGSRLYSFRAAP